MTLFARKILVVDDEPIIRTLIAERLAQSGFETFTAQDALSAKRVMLTEDPDALVVDLDLGDGPSGTELITALSALNPALGFVILTNYIPTPAELKASEHIEYLNKRDVSDVQLIVEALDRVLRDRASLQLPDSANSKLSSLAHTHAHTLTRITRTGCLILSHRPFPYSLAPPCKKIKDRSKRSLFKESRNQEEVANNKKYYHHQQQ